MPNFFSFFGLQPKRALCNLKYLPDYVRDYLEFKKQQSAAADSFGKINFFPVLTEKHESSGTINGAYFHQDLLVARRVFENEPARHVDVGSRVDGFVAHVAAFRKIEIIDIRPLTSSVKNISFLQADMMQELPSELIGCCDSLSCLHTIEHFGLGRYGDPIHFDGHLLGLANLRQVLKSGGKFYFSTPIGRQRIEFNAHRIFSIKYLVDYFSKNYRIDHFSYIDDAGDLHENASLAEDAIKENHHCHLGCGIFEMTKL